MKELAKVYQESINILNERVKELNRLKASLILSSDNPEKDSDIVELSERLRPLKTILKDIREVTKEIEHYYDKGWWRSEKYTFNPRKPRQHVYSEPIYDDASDKQNGKAKNGEAFGCGYRIITHRKTKKSC